MTTLRLTNVSPASAKADALVVFMTMRKGGPAVSRGTPTTKGLATKLAHLLTAASPTAKAGDVVLVPSAGLVTADVIVFACIAVDSTTEDVRRVAGSALRAAGDRKTVAVATPADSPEIVAAVGQGARLGAYRFTAFRSGTEKESTGTSTILLVAEDARSKAVKVAVADAETVTKAVIEARDLVNTPPSALTPHDFAEFVRRHSQDTSIRVDIYNERKLAREGYGGIIGVGQGSDHPPRLVRMTYSPPRARGHLAFVGKGITFDSGGLSLKPPPAMITMKCDMAGAAAVATATLAIARLGIPVKVTAYLALAENMPSGAAQRPGDVLTMYNGTTVEVLNTDAEGRLVMADAIARACEDSPDVLVDVATLTGAQTIALGTHVSAIMANDDELRDRVAAAAELAGESMWPMPLPPELRPSLNSKVADLANIGERMGGMLTAGLFLSEFVTSGTSWAHLDIAGPAFNEGSPHGYTPAGGTGIAVRTLVALAEQLAD